MISKLELDDLVIISVLILDVNVRSGCCSY